MHILNPSFYGGQEKEEGSKKGQEKGDKEEEKIVFLPGESPRCLSSV
ncbi:MAG: hypothetical protein UY05_C0058G0005 [Candidatus Peregrinibacteria bacterium GW2011_GWA2_47_7]|nr:MAG: hypothetical protein UY05_C0058G0005 [Candidatus Peregrinibacteria bacterium GW2011_GWA2_47_7]